MQQKYDWPDKIPDEAIREAFANTDSVSFSARRFNHVPYRSIGLEGLGWWLPLTRVLPIIGITPQMLRPVFSPQREVVKRRFPFGLSWFGRNKNRYEVVEVELPEKIESYEQLGNFPLAEEPFRELAKILGKSVRVLREYGGTGHHRHLFTAHPSGEIVEAVGS